MVDTTLDTCIIRGMTTDKLYQPHYSNSRALIVGINDYQQTSPLEYAANDASEVAQVIKSKFGFPDTNVRLLLDKDATKAGILEAYFDFINNDEVEEDDRILFFFAGHGHTETGRRGETGFLVPFDGNIENLGSLIRWDELTRNAELIPAKHILFLMDSCYGGLALSRKPLPAGSMRFAKDMMQRYTRQVLTAGKADEPVADSGGTRPKHSIFTSHLLDGFDGKAATVDGLLTANGIMAYTYQSVSQDPYSEQTPHYGFIDGDGDVILDTSALDSLKQRDETDQDILVSVSPHERQLDFFEPNTEESIKELLSNPNKRIALDDYVSKLIRKTLEATSIEKFPVQKIEVTDETLAGRLKEYERAITDLQVVVTIIAHWGREEHVPLLEKVFARMAEANKGTGGTILWLALQWYPCLVLSYSAGISALSAKNYKMLAASLTASAFTEDGRGGESDRPFTLTMTSKITNVADSFKKLPGHERQYVPVSEYLFKSIQPISEDILFLGQSFEPVFDKFEVFRATTYADLNEPKFGRYWGPPGRFAWKETHSFDEGGPFSQMVKEATEAKDEWPPLSVGLYGGSSERFLSVSAKYKEIIDNLNWF